MPWCDKAEMLAISSNPTDSYATRTGKARWWLCEGLLLLSHVTPQAAPGHERSFADLCPCDRLRRAAVLRLQWAPSRREGDIREGILDRVELRQAPRRSPIPSRLVSGDHLTGRCFLCDRALGTRYRDEL